MSNPKTIQILIVDDHEVVLEGMASTIASDHQCEVIAKASNGKQAIDLFQDLNPDITILDLAMPGLDGIQTLQKIREINPQAKVIVSSAMDSEELVYQAIQAGAKSYIRKENLLDELVNTIKAVHNGQKILSSEIAAKYIARTTKPELTNRELEILQLIAQGKSNGEIAAELTITEGTVKAHVHKILNKLDVADRTSAVIQALKRGILRL